MFLSMDIKKTFIQDQADAASLEAEYVVRRIADESLDSQKRTVHAVTMDIGNLWISEYIPWMKSKDPVFLRNALSYCEHADGVPQIVILHVGGDRSKFMCVPCAHVAADLDPGDRCDVCLTHGHVNFFDMIIQMRQMVLIANYCSACKVERSEFEKTHAYRKI